MAKSEDGVNVLSMEGILLGAWRNGVLGDVGRGAMRKSIVDMYKYGARYKLHLQSC